MSYSGRFFIYRLKYDLVWKHKNIKDMKDMKKIQISKNKTTEISTFMFHDFWSS